MSVIDRVNKMLSDPDNRAALCSLIAWVKELFRRGK